jgi:hypothetical protein
MNYLLEYDSNKNVIGKHETEVKASEWEPNGVGVETIDENTYRQIDDLQSWLWDSANQSLIKKISATTDKPEILANGTDTATITATVDDTTSTETIELYNGAALVDSKPAVTGMATFLVTMTAPGTLTLTVKSTTKYGQRDVTIEGV